LYTCAGTDFRFVAAHDGNQRRAGGISQIKFAESFSDNRRILTQFNIFRRRRMQSRVQIRHFNALNRRRAKHFITLPANSFNLVFDSMTVNAVAQQNARKYLDARFKFFRDNFVRAVFEQFGNFRSVARANDDINFFV
jgi:hypothetical protein